MKAILQRVKYAKVEIQGQTQAYTKAGLLILFGVEKEDSEDKIAWMANKTLNLRIFQDENKKMNLSVLDIKGEITVVSQFTLAACCKKGTRPSFDNAMAPELAEKYYEKFTEELKKSGLVVQTGVFGADMKVSLLNDGPVTIILEK